MFVAQPSSAAGGGATVVSTGGTANGAGDGAGTNGGATGSYVIQGGYMLGNSSGGAAGNSQNYSHTARTSPATVSITEGEESSVPSADKKVCRGAKRRDFLLFFLHPHSHLVVAHWWRHSLVLSTGKQKQNTNVEIWNIIILCFCIDHDESFEALNVISNSKKTKPWPHHHHIITVHVMRDIFKLPEIPRHHFASQIHLIEPHMVM